jgi:hypothetical protein
VGGVENRGLGVAGLYIGCTRAILSGFRVRKANILGLYGIFLGMRSIRIVDSK